jgi:hypothetical protein
MIQCVFLDFDGVLRNWDDDTDGIERKLGIPLEAVREIAFVKLQIQSDTLS